MKRTKKNIIKKKKSNSQKRNQAHENDKGLKDDPEVFVLPPDLLHKLGINLGVVEQEDNRNANGNNADINTNISCNGANSTHTKILCSTNSSSEEDTPITKTAKLVKDTVFLSPTFIPFTNSLSGEIEIANVLHEDEIIRVNEVLLNNETLSTHSHSNNNIECEPSNYSFPKEYTDQNYCILPCNYIEEISNNPKNKKFCNVNNICVQSYESNLSLDSSLMLYDEKLNIINCESNKSPNIHIISEEIIEDSQLQEFKDKLSSNKDFFIPIDIDTIILQPLETTVDRKITTINTNNDCILQSQNIELTDMSNMPIEIIKPLMIDIEEFDLENNDNCIIESTENIQFGTQSVHSTFETNNFTDGNVQLISSYGDSRTVSEFHVENEELVHDENFVSKEQSIDSDTGDILNTVSQKSISSDENLNEQGKSTSESPVLINKSPHDSDTGDILNTISRKSISSDENLNEQGKSTSESPVLINKSPHDSDIGDILNTVSQKSISSDENLNEQGKSTSESPVLINKSPQLDIKPPDMQLNNNILTTQVIDSTINFEHANNDQNVTEKDILFDKVAEIASYLSTYKNAQPKKEKKFGFQAKFDKNKHSPVKVKYKSPKSKLFIQGVEKPGGWSFSNDNYSAKDFKTYQRNSTVKIYSKKYVEFKIYKSGTCGVNIDVDISNNYHITKEFCSCERYGKLKFDECTIIEHNTHCEKRSTNDNLGRRGCSTCEYTTETLADNFKMEISDLKRNCQLNSNSAEFQEISTFTDLYSVFESGMNSVIYSLSFSDAPFSELKLDSSNEVNVNKSLDITQSTTCKGAAGTMNEKKGLKRGTTETDKVEAHPSKASVKCGVCNALLTEQEWDSHVDTEHSCLAWRFGETLDVNDSKLISKLKAKASNGEQLKCSICGITYSCEKKILKHVQKCLKLQDAIQTRTFLNLKPNEKGASIEIQNRDSTNKCGVCSEDVDENDWVKHIQSVHNYLAWKDGQPPINVNDEVAVTKHLNDITKQYKELTLTCYKCGAKPKRVKTYLKHIKSCNVNSISNGTNTTVDSSTANTSITPIANDDINTLEIEQDLCKCGVCLQTVDKKNWFNHMASEHDYLAWKCGEKPPNFQDSEAIYKHLSKINKKLGGLMCSKCSFKGKYVNPYLKHLKNCEGTENSSISGVNNDLLDDFLDSESIVKICGVCRTQVESKLWINHLSKIHNYLAWEEGQPTFDTTDPLAINSHLHSMLKTFSSLICGKCGLVKRSVKIYMQHVTSCTETYDLFEGEKQVTCKSEILECALCSEKIPAANWRMHAMKKHYNIAWAIGEEPIDLKNISVIEKYLKKYKQNVKNLICQNCRLSRASYHGFYAHIIACGKTDEETEIFKNVCDICNGKYLFIYKNQHMAMHREKEYAKERKLKAANLKSAESETQLDEDTPRKRKAAEKAERGLKECKSISDQYRHNCSKCGFGSDDSNELTSHKCGAKEGGKEDWDASLAAEGSDSDSDGTDMDTDAFSENVTLKRARVRSHPVPSQQKLPFKVNDIKGFFQKCDEDFEKYHYTYDTLYPEWRKFTYEVIRGDEYLPPIKESCKVLFGKCDWRNLKRFEAFQNNEGRGYTMFAGGSVQQVSWVPDVRVASSGDGAGDAGDAGGARGAWLTVSCHNGSDVPRLVPEDTSSHQTMLQIWDFGDFNALPKFSFGIALDYGTAWSMSWCPSGARDLTDDPTDHPTEQTLRLGLLAIAFSNGSAYIFSVPYPPSLVKQNCPVPVYKLKPVAELRLFSSNTRNKYQATAISWSKQRGHTVVVVGYADGTIAYYDLATCSDLLRTVEDDVDIFYPFDDERPHNTAVLDLDVYPGGEHGSRGRGGATRSAGPTGARAGRWAARAPVPCAALAPLPHWPSAQLAGDELLVSSLVVNELEWCGGGRRLGGARAAAAGRGARVAAFAGRALRLLRTHPAYTQLTKKLLGLLQMVPLNNSKTKRTNDNLSMKIEPLTYEEAIKKYGIEYKINQEVPKQQEICPERFPLGDMTSLSFCEARAHCEWVALATHAGVVYVVST